MKKPEPEPDRCYDATTVISTPKKNRGGRPRKHADLRAAWRAAARAYRARQRRSVHARSDSEEWYTPAWLIDRLLAETGRPLFDLDPCSPSSEGPVPAVARFTRDEDGLSLPWAGWVFCNPPYGRVIARWIDKAIHEARAGARVILLVPARTDARWWHALIAAGGRPEFLQGRIKFEGPRGTRHSAPFPSAIVRLDAGDGWT